MYVFLSLCWTRLTTHREPRETALLLKWASYLGMPKLARGRHSQPYSQGSAAMRSLATKIVATWLHLLRNVKFSRWDRAQDQNFRGLVSARSHHHHHHHFICPTIQQYAHSTSILLKWLCITVCSKCHVLIPFWKKYYPSSRVWGLSPRPAQAPHKLRLCWGAKSQLGLETQTPAHGQNFALNFDLEATISLLVSISKTVFSSDSVAVFKCRLKTVFLSQVFSSSAHLTLPGPSAFEVATLWRITNRFIIIIFLYTPDSIDPRG